MFLRYEAAERHEEDSATAVSRRPPSPTRPELPDEVHNVVKCVHALVRLSVRSMLRVHVHAFQYYVLCCS